MVESAIEREFRRRADLLGRQVARHDRGVLIGFVLCLVPILPIPIVGLAISAFNLVLVRYGKLGVSEQRLIGAALICGLVASIAGAWLLVAASHVVLGTIAELWDFAQWMLRGSRPSPYTRAAEWLLRPIGSAA
jgi:hypothetical protein